MARTACTGGARLANNPAATLMATIKSFPMTVCGFTDDAMTKITTTQGYAALDEFLPT